jgi:phytoene dehydrogenase-like protein
MMDKKKVLIIGGGVAGLSAGIYGQLNGFETKILEMHFIPGGQCTAWNRKGYRFDYCLHWLIGTKDTAFNNIWKETNVINDNVKIVDSEIHTMLNDDKWGDFIIYTNIDKWQEYLLEMAPEDEKGIRKMCRQMKMGERVYPFENAPGLRKATDYIKALLKMRSLLFILSRYAKMPAKTLFKELKFKNPKLIYFLNKLYGEQDFSALVVIMMLGWFHAKNAGYLLGGSLAIAQRMADRYHKLGGDLLLQNRVKRILVENNHAVGVELADGTVINADYIISAADGHSTLYDMLEGKYLTPQLENAYKNWEVFSPFVQIAFGVNDKISSDASVIFYYKDNFSIGPVKLKNGYSILNQTEKDPTLSPKGKTVLILRFDCSWDQWENMTKEEHSGIKEMIREKGMNLLEKHYPGISQKVEVVDVSTPVTSVKFTGVWKGAYEGFLPTGNMVKKTLNNTIPQLKSFYMAGQWLFPGGGIPPAAQSGKWVIQQICKERKVKFRVE